jgi:hypothetical protein
MRTYLVCRRGQYIPASFPAEPNNLGGNELCSGGNYTEAFSNAYGWADTECTRASVFICELLRGWLGLRLALTCMHVLLWR